MTMGAANGAQAHRPSRGPTLRRPLHYKSAIPSHGGHETTARAAARPNPCSRRICASSLNIPFGKRRRYASNSGRVRTVHDRLPEQVVGLGGRWGRGWLTRGRRLAQ